MAVSVDVVGITKVFGRTVANRDMGISLRSGEVHGLLGQNGSGKSTLVGILTGHLVPDAGYVLLDGVRFDLSSPERALKAGIVGVYQNLMLVPSMTGLENIALAVGAAPSPALRTRLDLLSERFGLTLSLNVPVDRLDMAARQRIEFARSLLQEPRLLLLDEPTTFLPPDDVDDFLTTIERLADSGLATLLITHRLDEARRVCDQVTVIRTGSVVANFTRAELPGNHDLAFAMLGEKVSEPRHTNRPGDTSVLRVSALSTADQSASRVCLDDLDLEVAAGEIRGIAGVDGNGQIELLEAIAGVRPTRGRVELAGRDVSGRTYAERFRAGMELVSGDRMQHGIVPEFSVFEHFDFALRDQRRDDVFSNLHDYDVQPPLLDARAASLSGGNQQKMILARAFAAKPRLLLLAYPTQGLDVKAAARIHAALIEHARNGLAVVVVSSDLDELLELCDCVAVMYRGRIVGEQRREEMDRRQLARWFTGVADDEEHRVAAR